MTPEAIREDVSVSLERLRTDHLDLFLLDRDDESVPVGPLMAALDQEVRAGRVRALGVANWRPARVQQGNRWARERRRQELSVVSNQLSLAEANEPMWPGCLSVDRYARRWHEVTQFPLMAWSSQARGWFSGRHLVAELAELDALRVYRSAANLERLKRARALAGSREVTPTRIALAFVLDQPFPVVGLVGPASVEELDDALLASDLRLSTQERAFLDLDPLSARPARSLGSLRPLQ